MSKVFTSLVNDIGNVLFQLAGFCLVFGGLVWVHPGLGVAWFGMLVLVLGLKDSFKAHGKGGE